MASSPAKVILFGEHAVVYGQPAIAVPVSALRASATFIETDTSFEIVAKDLQEKVIRFDIDDPLAQVARLSLERIGQEAPLGRIEVESQIPIASGLGSGAAISSAIVRCLLEHFKLEMSNAEINEIVYEVEKVHHGRPSGIDNTVIVYEKAVYFVREKPIETIENRTAFTLLIGDTGKTALTKYAVSDVYKLYEDDKAAVTKTLDAIGNLVRQARTAMATGDIKRLGQLMLENHRYLQDLTVSSDELDTLVNAAMKAGALGAKLSGGGRGGNMIALVDEATKDKVQSALIHAGASHVFETIVEAN